MRKKKCLLILWLLFILISPLITIFLYENTNSIPFNIENHNNLNSSAQRTVTKQWIKNPTFEDPIEPTWYWENGPEGDNSDMDATTSPGQANFEVMGETQTFTVVSGIINSSTSPGWGQFNNPGFTLPDTALIGSSGCYASHAWSDDANQFPSVHWRTNISIPIDMSDYIITSASIEVIVNASVNANIDTPNDNGDWSFFAIGDSVTFYAKISDLSFSPPFYTIASNKTKYLGQQNFSVPTILSYSDYALDPVNEIDLITALNSAFEKDPDHSNFTLTLGIDIYSEDNLPGTDWDDFDNLYIKTCNLTFTVKKKIDQFTTLSWNQIGNKLMGASIRVIDASFNFKVMIDKLWLSSAPISDLRFIINNKTHQEGTLKLSTITTSFQEAKVGGFNVTNLINFDINMSISIEVFLKDTFELDQVYTISIDDVYLNITYIETFPDYGTDLQLFLNNINKTLDPVFQIPILDTLNITIKYIDNQTGDHISNATVDIEGKISGNLDEDIPLEQYYILIDTNQLGLGVSVLTIYAQKDNYELKSVQIFLEVIERATELELFINTTEISSNDTLDVKFDEYLDIIVNYTDTDSINHINGASVSLLGLGNFTEIGSQYNYTLNTNNLTQGINIITIFAQLDNYKSKTIQFFINVYERATKLFLFVEGIQRYDGNTISSQLDEFLNITVYYRDNLTNNHLYGASVDLLGIGALQEFDNQFNISLNTNSLNEGINIITIFAQLTNYQSQTTQFFINIQERSTILSLLVDDIQKDVGDTVNTQFDETLNITVLYRDNLTSAHISGATVDLIGIGNLDESGNQYNISINTNTLEKGINILTLFAQLAGYQPKTIQFFINVDERATELILYIDGNQKFQSDTIQVEKNEDINITVYFRDFLTSMNLNGANVELLGINNLTEIANGYNITINSNNLEKGVNILTIFAQLDNYQPKSIQFFIEVVDRATNLILFLNEADKTNDSVYELPIGNPLNITVRFLDNQSGFAINGALLQLIGEGLSENITEILLFSQYTIILNTSNLGIGVKLFTILAQAPNYETGTISIRITINRIKTIINTTTGVDFIKIRPREDYRILIILNNSDFGGTIKNATVSYRWDHGQGQLYDLDNDGIYEILLENVPAGSYVIEITAFAGENYEFETFEMIINAIAEPGINLMLIVILMASGLAGLSIGIILYQKHFKFPLIVRKTRKLRKRMGKDKKLKAVSVQTRDSLIKDKIRDNKDLLKTENVEPELNLKETKKKGGSLSK